VHPRVGPGNAIAERVVRAPPKGVDPLVAEVARLHTHRALDVSYLNRLPRHLDDGLHELRHRDILGAPDVRRADQGGCGEPIDAVHHVVDIGVGANCLPITPHFDGATIRRLRHLPTDGGGRLLPAARPRAFLAVAILKPSDAYL